MGQLLKCEAAMTPYVFVVAVAKLLVILSGVLLQTAGLDLGGSHSIGLAIATIIAGVAWFAYRVDRPMTRGERLRFASGVAALDLGLSAAVLLFAVLLSGQTITAQSIALALAGEMATSIGPMLLLLVGFATIMTFGAAYLFGWLLTRKLPAKRHRDRGPR